MTLKEYVDTRYIWAGNGNGIPQADTGLVERMQDRRWQEMRPIVLVKIPDPLLSLEQIFLYALVSGKRRFFAAISTPDQKAYSIIYDHNSVPHVRDNLAQSDRGLTNWDLREAVREYERFLRQTHLSRKKAKGPFEI